MKPCPRVNFHHLQNACSLSPTFTVRNSRGIAYDLSNDSGMGTSWYSTTDWWINSPMKRMDHLCLSPQITKQSTTSKRQWQGSKMASTTDSGLIVSPTDRSISGAHEPCFWSLAFCCLNANTWTINLNSHPQRAGSHRIACNPLHCFCLIQPAIWVMSSSAAVIQLYCLLDKDSHLSNSCKTY